MEQHQTFCQIYSETRDAILRFVVARIRRAGDEEDLLQEIYRKLFVYMERHGGAVRDPQRYLYGIAKKELARYYRRRAAAAAHEEPLSDRLPDSDPPPDELFYTRERAREVFALVQKEPLLSYQAFVLYYGFSMPVRRIAEELHCSEDAVRHRLWRTRCRIREAMEAQDRTEPEWERSNQ